MAIMAYMHNRCILNTNNQLHTHIVVTCVAIRVNNHNQGELRLLRLFANKALFENLVLKFCRSCSCALHSVLFDVMSDTHIYIPNIMHKGDFTRCVFKPTESMSLDGKRLRIRHSGCIIVFNVKALNP